MNYRTRKNVKTAHNVYVDLLEGDTLVICDGNTGKPICLYTDWIGYDDTNDEDGDVTSSLDIDYDEFVY